MDLPTHLIADPADRRTICGISDRTRAAYPMMWVAHVNAHREAHAKAGKPFVLCDVCEAGANAH